MGQGPEQVGLTLGKVLQDDGLWRPQNADLLIYRWCPLHPVTLHFKLILSEPFMSVAIMCKPQGRFPSHPFG